jgi:4-hydroxy-3-polyprenylbenzoate decarboxylase
MSLAKYLFIAAANDDPDLDVDDIPGFFSHVLHRCDWRRDLHFQTCTTIDTLDYSGDALNEGSKVVIAAAGPPIRELPIEVLPGVSSDHLQAPRLCLPGVLAVEAPGHANYDRAKSADDLCRAIEGNAALARFPLVVLVDDSQFTAASLNNFLWVTFTRSNPATDIHGAGAFVNQKHWGCRGPLVIDARTKPHHAPPLEPDPETARIVDARAARGGPLAKFL